MVMIVLGYVNVCYFGKWDIINYKYEMGKVCKFILFVMFVIGIVLLRFFFGMMFIIIGMFFFSFFIIVWNIFIL